MVFCVCFLGCSERIAGKDYSFSSDIWGCGLSVLAVAMGCYPFLKKTANSPDSSSMGTSLRRGVRVDDERRGGAQEHSGGYWHIMQAISQRPPIKKLLGKHSSFSPAFLRFLSASLHRDRHQRASADALLTHEFLAGGGEAAMTEECRALEEFSEQCCGAHHEKLGQQNSSRRLFPDPLNRRGGQRQAKQVGNRIHLHAVRVTLMADEDQDDGTHAEFKKLRYAKEIAEDMGYFFTVFAAYKDFVLKNWAVEGEENGSTAGKVDMNTESGTTRFSALQYLLHTTLSLPPVSPSRVDCPGDGAALARSSPSLAPLLDPTTILDFAELMHIPSNFVFICLRDFIMSLLSGEEESGAGLGATSVAAQFEKLDVTVCSVADEGSSGGAEQQGGRGRDTREHEEGGATTFADRTAEDGASLSNSFPSACIPKASGDEEGEVGEEGEDEEYEDDFHS